MILENTERRLVVRAGSQLNQTTLTLDKDHDRARLERNLLFWRRKPLDVALSDIADVEMRRVADAASGATIPVPTVRTHSGVELALPVDESEAVETVRSMCDFLDLKPH